jgi:hypothetical protein
MPQLQQKTRIVRSSSQTISSCPITTNFVAFDEQQEEEQRLDETEIGEATTVSLVDAKRPDKLSEAAPAYETAAYLGLDPDALGLVGWDVYDAVLMPGDLILMIAWKTKADAEAFAEICEVAGRRATAARPRRSRLRHVRPPRGAAILSRGGAPAARHMRALAPPLTGHPVR